LVNDRDNERISQVPGGEDFMDTIMEVARARMRIYEERGALARETSGPVRVGAGLIAGAFAVSVVAVWAGLLAFHHKRRSALRRLSSVHGEEG
jgi:hypothetical protein